MNVRPIVFTSFFRIVSGETHGIKDHEVKNDIEMAYDARKIGVDVPQYVVKEYEYKTKGERASYYGNPITNKHLGNVFKNIFLLDKNGIYHKDLDIEHVFYDEQGNVEIDCFRFAQKFAKNEPALPDFVAPTNQFNYETASLALYMENIYDNNAKRVFVENYLSECAKFHQKRAGMMARVMKDANRQNYTLEMFDYEQTKAKALQKVDADKVQLTLQRLDFMGKQRAAFTKWDEGNGACGHKFSKKDRIESIPMYLEAVKSAIEYSKMAENFASKTTGLDKKYYEYEAQFGAYFANIYLSWISGMAKDNFNNPKMESGFSTVEVDKIDAEYQKIIKADFDKKAEAIDEYLEIYIPNAEKITSLD
ncbi:MAG: hypothetical protein IJW73_04150 [Candidatus Gastranaerophilales bacterium]|nr:hypothetical protein [Candidatus Gastranaerophilales bacterium]